MRVILWDGIRLRVSATLSQALVLLPIRHDLREMIVGRGEVRANWPNQNANQQTRVGQRNLVCQVIAAFLVMKFVDSVCLILLQV